MKKREEKKGSKVKIMVRHRVFVCRADNRCQMKLAHTSVGDQKLLPALKILKGAVRRGEQNNAASHGFLAKNDNLGHLSTRSESLSLQGAR